MAKKQVKSEESSEKSSAGIAPEAIDESADSAPVSVEHGTEQSAKPTATEKPDKPPPPFLDLFELPENAKVTEIQKIVNRQMEQTASSEELGKKFTLLVLYDSVAIDRSDADRIYNALSSADSSKPILLTLHSRGGAVAPAYFIGKLCRENTEAEFQVAVPREAKSAATLICCGADRIHMGSLSELGPIDPQITGMPALAVKNSLEHMCEMVRDHPQAKDMLVDYLNKSLPIEVLGYYERAAESAVQYAERLLTARVSVELPHDRNSDIARKLVYDYKDHRFAIDAAEAISIFGEDVVLRNSPEYELANRIYQMLDFLKWAVSTNFDRELAFTGSISSGAWVRSKQQ